MDRLQQLRKESQIALGKYQLVAIACLSASPEHAYSFARDCCFDDVNAQSVKALASIYFEFGDSIFQEELWSVECGFMERICTNSDHHEGEGCYCGTYDNICLCICHLCRSCDRGLNSCGDKDECDCSCHDYESPCRHCVEHHNNFDEDDEYEDEEEYMEEYDNETPEERLERIAERLAGAGGSFCGSYVVVSNIKGKSIQAIATEEGGRRQIQITRSLIETLNDDELAFVVAHEIGHHEHDHGHQYKEAVHTSVEEFSSELSSLNEKMKQEGHGKIVRGITLLGSAALGTAAVVLNAKGKSRAQEEEADKRAIDLTAAAGYDPSSAESALSKLHGGYLPDAGALNTLLSTHPNPRTRGRKMRQYAQKKNK